MRNTEHSTRPQSTFAVPPSAQPALANASLLAPRDAKGRFVVSDTLHAALAEAVSEANSAVAQRRYPDAQRFARTALASFHLGDLRQVTALSPLEILDRLAERLEVRPLVARALYICARGIKTSSIPTALHISTLLLERATLLDPSNVRLTTEFAVWTFGLNYPPQLLRGYGMNQRVMLRGSALRAIEQTLSVVCGIEAQEVMERSLSQAPHSITFPRHADANEVVRLMGKAAILSLGAARFCIEIDDNRMLEAFEHKGLAFLRQFLLANELEFNYCKAAVTLKQLVVETPSLVNELPAEFPQVFEALSQYYRALSRRAKKQGHSEVAREFDSYRAECRITSTALQRPVRT